MINKGTSLTILRGLVISIFVSHAAAAVASTTPQPTSTTPPPYACPTELPCSTCPPGETNTITTRTVGQCPQCFCVPAHTPTVTPTIPSPSGPSDSWPTCSADLPCSSCSAGETTTTTTKTVGQRPQCVCVSTQDPTATGPSPGGPSDSWPTPSGPSDSWPTVMNCPTELPCSKCPFGETTITATDTVGECPQCFCVPGSKPTVTPPPTPSPSDPWPTFTPTSACLPAPCTPCGTASHPTLTWTGTQCPTCTCVPGAPVATPPAPPKPTTTSSCLPLPCPLCPKPSIGTSTTSAGATPGSPCFCTCLPPPTTTTTKCIIPPCVPCIGDHGCPPCTPICFPDPGPTPTFTNPPPGTDIPTPPPFPTVEPDPEVPTFP
ncbi:hypothetical protein FA13DRAFT_874048 [Coprinellus micaceus]|uniref:Antistasin-like domain-containing protein n=1 Tax=Coprinellus micaceus TaxID=71717 RepID=A0A4Y7T088_COPMI|nr:hypothetical protein FA13DRAFT_874048 [Coprinellus micaceus]